MTSTGTAPHRKTRRRRGAPCALGTVRLPHRDLDTAVAGLRSVVGRLDEQVGLAVGDHFDGRPGETCLDENLADADRALQTERKVRSGVTHRVGMPDDNNL